MTREEALAKHVQYSWVVLEHKWRYYVGRFHGVQAVSDEKYDKIEESYKKLCTVLKLPTSASSMVGFDFKRASCRMVHDKMCKLYNLNSETTTWVG